MINTLDPTTVEKYVHGTRLCRSCGYDLPVDPERASDHWYITKAGRLSAYCKECMKKKVVQCRWDRKAGIKKIRTECSVCGHVRKVTWDEDVPVCRSCETAYTAADGSLTTALAIVKWIRDHNDDVEERRASHNSDRVFWPHPDGIYGKVPYPDHRDCARAEISARAVVKFLASRRQDGHSRPS